MSRGDESIVQTAASPISGRISTMPQRNLLLLLLATAASYTCYVQGGQNPYRRYAADGLTAIESNSLDNVTDSELFAGAMEGMVDVLNLHGDQHSQFYTAAEAGALRNEIHQQIGGIGVRVVRKGDPPQVQVAGPIAPESPAALAKLGIGDRILKINGRNTSDLRMQDVVEMLRGEPGTTVHLSIQSFHDSQPHDLDLIRKLVQVESLLGDRRSTDGHWVFVLEDELRIAHIRIVSFGDHTALEFAMVLDDLTNEGVQAIVLDMRGNAGGALGSAVALCEMLLPAGKTIVEMRGRNQNLRQRYTTKVDGRYRELPAAVIVNQYSASASEIVAACLQDHGRAVVVGQRSFGKGTVQQMLPLGKSLLKLTSASFWRPSGANIHRAVDAPESATWGVAPDVGYERSLSSEEYDDYRKFRVHRDNLDQTEVGTDTASDAAMKNASGVEFVDEPLKLAQSYLQSQLDTKH